MEYTKQKYDDPSQEYNLIPGNKHFIRTDDLLPIGEHSFDLEEEIAKHRENESDRLVLGCRANNESLPFKDGTFDCYLANLSMMLVRLMAVLD